MLEGKAEVDAEARGLDRNSSHGDGEKHWGVKLIEQKAEKGILVVSTVYGKPVDVGVVEANRMLYKCSRSVMAEMDPPVVSLLLE